MSKIQKDYGQGSVRRLGDEELVSVEPLPTGHWELDAAFGIGGFPRGRIVELYGPESSGKTTLAIHAIAEAHKKGYECAFIDVEHAFDPHYAQNLGVDIDRLIFSQPDTAEEALSIVDELVDTGEIALIVIDSVAALTPRAELQGDMGDSHMGLQARLMGQALRKLTGKAQKNDTCLIFINQIREKIGVMFGSPETTPGGRALKFYASMRVDVRRRQFLKEDGAAAGNDTDIKVVKNKVAAPFKEATVQIFYGEGIDIYGPGVTLGVNTGVLEKKGGNHYDWDGNKFATSGDAARTYAKENPDFWEELNRRIQARITTGEVV